RTISGAVFDLYSYNGTGDAGNLANYSLFSNDTEYQKKDFTVSGVTINGVYTDGIYISGYVPSGNYAIVETKAPAGFTVDPTPRFFEVKSGETEEISVDNCAQGAIRINKVSSEGKKSPIEGVEFKLYKGKVDGSITLNELTLVGTEKTDKNGQVTFFNLDAGVYTIQESATVKGFKLDTTLYSVNVAKKGSVDVYEQIIENVPD
ncbi:MAG: prealbumin-like fold domain-containing protein, partial [Oscillospiraceae bacterium]